MTTRISLICHASTTAVRGADFPLDEPLDDHGLRKLGAVSKAAFHAGEAWTSPARRAIQTAEALGMKAAVDPSLRDWDHGRWGGRSLTGIEADEPEALMKWLRDPGAAPHGGETLLDVLGRTATWLKAQKAAAGRVIAVTHASIIRAVVVGAIEAPPHSFWRIDVAPLSVTTLTCGRERWSLASIGPLPTKTPPR